MLCDVVSLCSSLFLDTRLPDEPVVITPPAAPALKRPDAPVSKPYAASVLKPLACTSSASLPASCNVFDTPVATTGVGVRGVSGKRSRGRPAKRRGRGRPRGGGRVALSWASRDAHDVPTPAVRTDGVLTGWADQTLDGLETEVGGVTAGGFNEECGQGRIKKTVVSEETDEAGQKNKSVLLRDSDMKLHSSVGSPALCAESVFSGPLDSARMDEMTKDSLAKHLKELNMEMRKAELQTKEFSKEHALIVKEGSTQERNFAPYSTTKVVGRMELMEDEGAGSDEDIHSVDDLKEGEFLTSADLNGALEIENVSITFDTGDEDVSGLGSLVEGTHEREAECVQEDAVQPEAETLCVQANTAEGDANFHSHPDKESLSDASSKSSESSDSSESSALSVLSVHNSPPQVGKDPATKADRQDAIDVRADCLGGDSAEETATNIAESKMSYSSIGTSRVPDKFVCESNPTHFNKNEFSESNPPSAMEGIEEAVLERALSDTDDGGEGLEDDGGSKDEQRKQRLPATDQMECGDRGR